MPIFATFYICAHKVTAFENLEAKNVAFCFRISQSSRIHANLSEELRAVIRTGKPQVKLSSWLVHFVSRYASVKKRKG
ncbi:MAG: hypothetical protein LC108_12255 [Anaerolineales bacterium]|nr:hypothetical protein [Anaerolineales bacterium]